MSNIQLQIYDYSMAAGGSFQLPVAGSYFRILTSLGDVDVIGDTFGRLGPINKGQGLADKEYGRLTIRDRSGAPNAGTILVSDANFIDQTLFGSISLAGAVTLDAATLAALEYIQVRPEDPTASYADASALTANVPLTVFTPAANTNGAILLSASMQHGDTVGIAHCQAFLSKTSAPVSPTDGAVLLQSGTISYVSAGVGFGVANLAKEQKIPAGQGLYFIDSVALGASAAQNMRACRYRLL